MVILREDQDPRGRRQMLVSFTSEGSQSVDIPFAMDCRFKIYFDPGSIKVYQSPGHTRNFLDSVKSRKPCVAPPETAHRSITPGHLGYVANAVRRPVRWDAKSERIVDDDEAERLLKDVTYRSPWKLST